MTNTEQMPIRVSERAAILERATRLLKQDPRIDAAWLHGSMGRGTHDEWSDIDLWIVVADDQMEALRAERQDFVSRLGHHLLTIEAPQNAPPGGAYLLAMYPGANGPHILDCSWQPMSSARRPLETILLFDRLEVPIVELHTTVSPEARTEKAVAQTRFFWTMTTMIAKYIARDRPWEVIGLLSLLSSVLNEIEWLVGERANQPTYRDHPDFPPPLISTGQLAALRNLLARMSKLMANMPALAEAVPAETLEQIDLFLALIGQELA